MWISRKIGKSSFSALAEKGEVTLSSGENWEASASQSVRNVGCYLPYGYSAKAPVGEEVLLLGASDGTVALGVKSKPDGQKAGEIKISSLGGATIELKNDGSVIINKKVKISSDGSVSYGD